MQARLIGARFQCGPQIGGRRTGEVFSAEDITTGQACAVKLIADLATGEIRTAGDLETGPIARGCTAVNVAAGPATIRDYVETVTRALGLEPVWGDRAAWTGQILADRARAWGWAPEVGLPRALAEVATGLSG